jgi:hypothetical protein
MSLMITDDRMISTLMPETVPAHHHSCDRALNGQEMIRMTIELHRAAGDTK